jgi:hypothetical protein
MAERAAFRPIARVVLMLGLLLSGSTLQTRAGIPLATASASAAPTAAVIIDTGLPDGRMGMASRPDVGAVTEIEAADDFILTAANQVSSGTFFILLPTGQPLTAIQDVIVEIYRVFPKDSTNPPSGRVPTRVNSPSDVAFDSRSASGGSLTFTSTLVNGSFAVSNSVVNGIHPIPNQTTGGDGPVTGQEVRVNVTFTTPFSLPADQYFFVPQVKLASGVPLWLSAPGPSAATDLQAWIRNAALDPDWLRVGTDIVGGATPPRFNAAFSLQGSPSTGLPADADNNTFLDVRDYGVWRQQFGVGGCANPADFDGNCIVDVRDYGIWRQNFGHSGPGTSLQPSRR